MRGISAILVAAAAAVASATTIGSVTMDSSGNLAFHSGVKVAGAIAVGSFTDQEENAKASGFGQLTIKATAVPQATLNDQVRPKCNLREVSPPSSRGCLWPLLRRLPPESGRMPRPRWRLFAASPPGPGPASIGSPGGVRAGFALDRFFPRCHQSPSSLARAPCLARLFVHSFGCLSARSSAQWATSREP